MTLEELEARIKILEDIEAIKKLTSTFSYFTDAGNWQAAVNLFTEDAVLKSAMGQYKGKAEITKVFRDDTPQAYSFMMHMCHNPVIKVNGEKANGEWYAELPATHAPTNRALWIAVKWEFEYVKVGGEWKIERLVSKPYYFTPYDEGWVKTKMYG